MEQVNSSDGVIMEALRSGERWRFQEGWVAWQTRDAQIVRDVARRYKYRDEDDVIQEVFIRIVPQVARPDFHWRQGSLRGYVWTVSRNILLRDSQRRKKGREESLHKWEEDGMSLDTLPWLRAPESEEPEAQIVRGDLETQMAAAIAARLAPLPPHKRYLLQGIYWEERPHQEIAVLLGRTTTSIGVAHHRLKHTLACDEVIQALWEMLVAMA